MASAESNEMPLNLCGHGPLFAEKKLKFIIEYIYCFYFHQLEHYIYQHIQEEYKSLF